MPSKLQMWVRVPPPVKMSSRSHLCWQSLSLLPAPILADLSSSTVNSLTKPVAYRSSYASVNELRHVLATYARDRQEGLAYARDPQSFESQRVQRLLTALQNRRYRRDTERRSLLGLSSRFADKELQPIELSDEYERALLRDLPNLEVFEDFPRLQPTSTFAVSTSVLSAHSIRRKRPKAFPKGGHVVRRERALREALTAPGTSRPRKDSVLLQEIPFVSIRTGSQSSARGVTTVQPRESVSSARQALVRLRRSRHSRGHVSTRANSESKLTSFSVYKQSRQSPIAETRRVLRSPSNSSLLHGSTRASVSLRESFATVEAQHRRAAQVFTASVAASTEVDTEVTSFARGHSVSVTRQLRIELGDVEETTWPALWVVMSLISVLNLG